MRDVAVIEELRISDLGVIKESVLPLGAGFTAITGETGAGKTMLITALGLLLGGRSESGIVREGATAARVEGSVFVDAALAEQVDARGGVVEEDTLLISRQISAQGRSRAFLGGSTVPAAVLGEISRSLITIHGQADQLRLLRPGTALNALDAFGGPDLGRTRKAYSAVFDQLKDVERLLHEETTDARAQALELDLLRHGVEEISRVAPSPGEDVDLAHEEARLGAADNLRAAAAQAREALSSDAGGGDAISALSVAIKELQRVADLDTTSSELLARASEIGALISDLAGDVSSYLEDVEADPIRLAVVSERRSALAALTRKYGEDIAEVLQWASTAADRIDRIDGSEDRIRELQQQREKLRTELGTLAEELSERRRKAAANLGDQVTSEIRQLSMPHAQLEFEVRQQPADPGSDTALLLNGGAVTFAESGIDQVEINFVGHSGAAKRPYTKVHQEASCPGSCWPLRWFWLRLIQFRPWSLMKLTRELGVGQQWRSVADSVPLPSAPK